MTTVRELHQKFHRKLDDHLFIIQQQRDRIDYQQQQIDGQRFLIEELAWQIRDLRDSLRKSDEKLHAVLLQMTTAQDKKYCPKWEEVSDTKDTNPIHLKRVPGKFYWWHRENMLWLIKPFVLNNFHASNFGYI